MARYRRNAYRQEVINRFGQTTGLPLFESVSKPVPEPTRSRFENAPKAVAKATDTRKLAHVSLQHNLVDLSNKQQLVLDTFRDLGPSTNNEVAHYLRKEAGWVSARNNELREFGLLVAAGKRCCRISGNVVHLWEVVLK